MTQDKKASAQKKIRLIAGLLIAALAVVGLHVIWSKTAPSRNEAVLITSDSEWGKPEVAQAEAEKAATELAASSESYVDAPFGISFRYPKGFVVTHIAGDGEISDAETLLIQNAQKNIGLQISAFAFDEPIEHLTKDRIEAEFGSISNYSIIKIGKKENIQAVTFLTGDTVKYREVWFVKEGTLFQTKAYQSSEPLVVAIMKTLEI